MMVILCGSFSEHLIQLKVEKTQALELEPSFIPLSTSGKLLKFSETN